MHHTATGLETFLVVMSIFIPIFLVICEISGFIAFGWFLNDKILNEALDQHIRKGCHINPFDENIITIGEMPYIATTPFGVLFSSYHINNVGRVRYGTLAHKRIKNIHTQLKRQWEAEHPKETEIRKQLKIK